MYRQFLRLSISYGIALLLGACGGSGGTGAGQDDSKAENAGVLLGAQGYAFSGSLFFEYPRRTVELNLSSGTLNAVYDGFSAPSRDGEEFTLLREGALFSDELGVIRRDGMQSLFFEKEADLVGPAKLSPDHSLIAVKWLPDSNNPPGGLAIFDRGGDLKKLIIEQESTLFEQRPTINSWEWLPDGGLIYAEGNAIYKTDHVPLTTSYLLHSFDQVAPSHLAVSPDGLQVAFTLGGLPDQRIHVMNIDGSGLRQLIQSGKGEQDGPTWSPDGRFIAFRSPVVFQGPLPDLIPIVNDVCPNLYIVPAEAESLDIDGPHSDSFKVQISANNAQRTVCAFSPPEWRATTDLPSKPGTKPFGTGANSGLSGRLFFSDFIGEGADTSFGYLDLNTGKRTKLPGDNDEAYALFPAEDGEELAMAISNREDFDNDLIRLQRLDGTITAEFHFPQDRTNGAPRLSPNGLYIAVGWYSPPQGGKDVVAVYNRNGTRIAQFDHCREWAWHDSDQLFLGCDKKLYFTDSNFERAVLVLEFPDTIFDLDYNAIDKKLAYIMGGHLWVLDNDDRTTQLTLSTGGESGASWSPDGQYIAVTYSEGSCRDVYVVPADGERIFIGNSSVESSATLVESCIFSDATWRE